MINKEEIEELESIRMRITQIYIQLGNPIYVTADQVLNQDIVLIKEKCNGEDHNG